MYEVLIDHFEDDDETPHADELDLDDKVADPLDLDVDVADDELAIDPDVEDELTDANDEELLEADELESWSDDPVRMYLTQMGEIPL